MFAAMVWFGIWHSAGSAAAASARDCVSIEETEADDVLSYRNECNRAVIFYYCVVDPQHAEVAPCRKIITGTKRISLQHPKGPTFFTTEMDPRTTYEVKLWGGSRIKWAACDAELGGLESFQPKGNAALDFSYDCQE